MRRRLVAVVTVVSLLGLLPAPASAATVDVTVAGTSFSPARVKRPTGTTVTWRKNSGFHNVSSRQGMFRSGDPTGESFTFSRTFSAGRYPYICEIHAPDMTGVIRIRPRVKAKPTGPRFTVRWASPATNTGDRFRVQYRVAGGKWRTWRSGTTAYRGVFGRKGVPVRARAGVRYRFRVKSRLGSSASRYSPVKSYTP